jgi:uncharacterized membrane protein YhfC
MVISAIISIGLPIVLLIIFRKKYNAGILPMVIGIITFIVFALVLERSVHRIVLGNFNLLENPFVYILYGIFMAGIFEETARFISFNMLKKRYNGVGIGLAYGLGHGGIESILIVGLSMINNIAFCILLNTGGAETIISKLQGDALAQLNVQINTLVNTAPYMFLIGVIERIFAITVQISLSMIVYYSVYGKNKICLFPLAIILHAIVDIPAAAMQAGIIKNMLFTEVLVFFSAMIVSVFAIKIHNNYRTILTAWAEIPIEHISKSCR